MKVDWQSRVTRAMALEQGFPEWFDEIYEREMMGKIGGFCSHHAGLDHQRHYKNVAFAQPYDAEGDQLALFLEVCRLHCLKVYLNGASYYFPGRTFSIAVWRPQDQAQFQEYLFWAEDISAEKAEEDE